MPVTLALRQENYMFEASIGYIPSSKSAQTTQRPRLKNRHSPPHNRKNLSFWLPNCSLVETNRKESLIPKLEAHFALHLVPRHRYWRWASPLLPRSIEMLQGMPSSHLQYDLPSILLSTRFIAQDSPMSFLRCIFDSISLTFWELLFP